MMQFLKKNQNIILILFFALILRFFLSFFGTLHLDQGTFIAWSNILVHDGFKSFYNGWSDYLPGYLYILWGLGKINLLGIVSQPFLYKFPANIADILTGFLIYKIIAKSKGEKWGIFGTIIYLFNPAIIFNSAIWGQVDSLTALLSLFSIFTFPTSVILSAASLAFGTIVKPQTAFIFPVILFMMVKEKWKLAKILSYLFVGLLVFVLGFVPFWNHGNLISFIYERLGVSLNQYQNTSVNAFNFWGIVGFWKPDNIYYQLAGYVLVTFSSIFLFFKLWKVKNPEYYFLSFIFGATFIFFTRMHERHLLPIFAPLVVAAVENPYLLIPYIGFSVTYVANLYYSYIWITYNFRQIFSDFFIKFFEVINIGLITFIFYTLVRNINLSWERLLSIGNKFISNFKKPKVQVIPLPKIHLSKNSARLILAGILLFAAITRLFDLGSPSSEYFDEVYHAFTAKVILHGDPKAWEWWNTPPTGFAYEWTHPPVAKLGMVLGMLVFGENSFGYRIPGALLGIGSVLLVYLLAVQIFKDEAVGLLSAAAFSLDGLTLVMSRIGMNDSYLLFFSLLAIYLYLRDKNFLSAIFFGLAVASKWSAIWAIPIFGIIFLSRKKKLSWSYVWFFVLPLAVYLGSYFDMFLTGHNLSIWWGMQEQMWWYHTGLKATHSYSSMWWSWPFLIRPIYLYTSDEVMGMVARIYAMGNPFIFWFGLVSILASFVYSYLEKNKNLALVVFSYLIFFTPWALSPRIMFLYHYLPSIPFMCIAIGYILRRFPKLISTYLFICLLAFIYFYPHWAGLQIPLWLDKSYYWVASWR
ncbi:MAG TPA: glycosyltransferase family 39 protein [Patescibacteria group bacterium]|nr:glycosyltransferase family 39 protein [Patescibacteria group bacterium]